MVSARLLRNSMGATMSMTANNVQMMRRPTFQGLNRQCDVALEATVVVVVEFMASVLPRAQQALGAEDQDQHEEQVRQDGRNLGNRELEQGVAEGLVRHRHAH